MNGSLRYIANDVYETSLDSGDILISRKEIIELAEELNRIEDNYIESLETDLINKSNSLVNKLLINAIPKIKKITLESDKLEEFLDKFVNNLQFDVCVKSADVAKDYYTQNFIISK